MRLHFPHLLFSRTPLSHILHLPLISPTLPSFPHPPLSPTLSLCGDVVTVTASGSESDRGMGSLRSTRFASSGFGSSGCALVQAEMTGGPHGDHSTGSEDHDQGRGVQAWSGGSNAAWLRKSGYVAGGLRRGASIADSLRKSRSAAGRLRNSGSVLAHKKSSLCNWSPWTSVCKNGFSHVVVTCRHLAPTCLRKCFWPYAKIISMLMWSLV